MYQINQINQIIPKMERSRRIEGSHWIQIELVLVPVGDGEWRALPRRGGSPWLWPGDAGCARRGPRAGDARTAADSAASALDLNQSNNNSFPQIYNGRNWVGLSKSVGFLKRIFYFFCFIKEKEPQKDRQGIVGWIRAIRFDVEWSSVVNWWKQVEPLSKVTSSVALGLP